MDRSGTQDDRVSGVPPPSRSLIVSLHDVSPHTFEASRNICDELEALGVRGISLLVVPNHHHRGHFLQDRSFCDWLTSMCARGHEAVIHGYYHLREVRPGENLSTRTITRVYTAGEGEFYDIGKTAAQELVGKARGEFHELGLHPIGFIAPAWLISDGAAQALAALGIRYTTRLHDIWNIATGRKFPSQSLVYSTRAAWRRVCSLAWNSYLFQRMRPHPVLRAGIHPPDAAHPRIWRQIRTLITRALEDRQAITYQAWVTAQTE